MYCSRCGTWAPDSAPACARCGEALAPAPARAPEIALELPVVEGVEVVAAPVVRPRYAGFWRRAAAMLVDGIVLFFPDAILRTSLGLPTAFSAHTLREDEMGRMFVAIGVMTAVWWWYCARLESSAGQGTLGQQLLGVRVSDGLGQRISFARASGRYFAQWLSALLCGGGYLFNLWTPRRQTLHDMLAGCVLTVPAAEHVPGGVIVTGRTS